MRKTLFITPFIGFLLTYSLNLFAQCNTAPSIIINNPSFEGAPIATVTPVPWTECGLIPADVSVELPGLPSVETPDTQPGFFGITKLASNGNTYLGLVWDSIDYATLVGLPTPFVWQEGASQQLSSAMVAGTEYCLYMDLANSTQIFGGQSGCTRCEILGGFSGCDADSVLWMSDIIAPSDTWMTYKAVFTPDKNFTWITVRINGSACSFQPYILVDNLSNIGPTSLSGFLTLTQALHCPNDSNAQAVLHVTGLFPPFTYSWSTTQVINDSTIGPLAAGTYSVTITDANSCTASTSLTIANPAPLSGNAFVTNPVCTDATTGAVNIVVSGGAVPYTYTWSNGDTVSFNDYLAVGDYTVTVNERFGCANLILNFSIVATSALTATIQTNGESCHGDQDATLTAVASGGTAPYTYHWNNNATTISLNNVPPSSYFVVVYDSNSCSALASISIYDPDQISPALQAHEDYCGDSTGSIQLTATGGTPPYTYLWSNGDTSAFNQGLGAGDYSITVTDSHGCTAINTNLITSVPAISVNIITVNVNCFGGQTGSVDAIISGGTGSFESLWSNGQVGLNVSGFGAGDYSVTVTDDNNCTAAGQCTISQPAEIQIAPSETDATNGHNGTANINVSGGVTPYTYLWSNDSTGTSISNLVPGIYTVTVTDSLGCMQTDSVTINEIINGIYSNNEDFAFAVYPNPAKNEISIETKTGIRGQTTLRLLDVIGQALIEKSLTAYKSSLDISNLASGVYFVELRQNNLRSVKKVIVDR